MLKRDAFACSWYCIEALHSPSTRPLKGKLAIPWWKMSGTDSPGRSTPNAVQFEVLTTTAIDAEKFAAIACSWLTAEIVAVPASATIPRNSDAANRVASAKLTGVVAVAITRALSLLPTRMSNRQIDAARGSASMTSVTLRWTMQLAAVGDDDGGDESLLVPAVGAIDEVEDNGKLPFVQFGTVTFRSTTRVNAAARGSDGGSNETTARPSTILVLAIGPFDPQLQFDATVTSSATSGHPRPTESTAATRTSKGFRT
mmetsp:Transcript_32647/g.100978  ORF Transcript_32647/g.100978 Transcript_32647/m.100978 type:complete len:257 (+) Transcript_32647:1777-2547(+)